MADATGSGSSVMPVLTGVSIVAVAIAAGIGWDEAASNGERVTQLEARVAELEAAKPGIGEAMVGVNTHFTQAYFAGLNGRWGLATHELEELGEAFDLAAALKPEVEGVKVAEWVGKFKEGPGKSLASAVAKQDTAAWSSAVDEALLMCNACHAMTKHEFVSVGRPAAAPPSALRLGPRATRACRGRRPERETPRKAGRTREGLRPG